MTSFTPMRKRKQSKLSLMKIKVQKLWFFAGHKSRLYLERFGIMILASL
jgi:hypothetical protein